MIQSVRSSSSTSSSPHHSSNRKNRTSRSSSTGSSNSSTGEIIDHRNTVATRPHSNNNNTYVPPAVRRLQSQPSANTAAVPGSRQDQWQSWEEQRRIIHGTINRLNESTIKPLIHELFDKCHLLRMRGPLAQSLLRAALSSTHYSPVYAALVAVIHTKLPEIGDLVVQRSILLFRKHFRLRNKQYCLAISIFMAHLFHQHVVHELLILQILTLLLEDPTTDDAVQVAAQLMQVVGPALLEVSPAGVRAVLERLRSLLQEGQLSTPVELQVEQLLTWRKSNFPTGKPPVPETLDLVEEEDQITLEISLDDPDISSQDHLNTFHENEHFLEEQEKWAQIRAEILGLDGASDASTDSDTEDDDDDQEDESSSPDHNQQQENSHTDTTPHATTDKNSTTVFVHDLTEADLINLRRQIYLTIMSSATFEECTHKLAKIKIPPGREEEMVNMLIECCSQERTFLRYYGLIGTRFCLLEERWRDAFIQAFQQQYTTIHRLETNKLRNVAKFFAHLLQTDAIPWSVFQVVHLNHEETNSGNRIFLKIVLQDLSEALGISKLKARLEPADEEMKLWFKHMLPMDNPVHTRYSINFFTSIGLGPITDSMREYLKNAPKQQEPPVEDDRRANDDDSSLASSSSSSSSSSSLSSSSSSSLSSSSSSSYSRSHTRRKRRRSSSSSYSRSRERRRRRRRSVSSSRSPSPRRNRSYSR